MKILTVVGARPQFIKAAVTSKAISEYNNRSASFEISELLVHTGQHSDFEMSSIFFDFLKLPPPSYRLSSGGLSHASMTAFIMEKIEKILDREHPDLLMCFGDTNSTLAACLAAAKVNIPIAHVESGLRSFDMAMPEEINRVLADRLSSFLFCTSSHPVKLLEAEGFPHNSIPTKGESKTQKIEVVGDVMLDATHLFAQQISESTKLQDLGLQNKDYILATLHRQSNVDIEENLASILGALDQIALTTTVVLPLHPRTKKNIQAFNLCHLLNRLMVIKPIGYFDMHKLISQCSFVITDSGGLQKESYFYNKSCGILRDTTEWSELISDTKQKHMLLGVNRDYIYDFAQRMKTDISFCVEDRNTVVDSIYGHGNAGAKIINSLATFWEIGF